LGKSKALGISPRFAGRNDMPEILEAENSLQMRQDFDSRTEENTDKNKK
jgi:hypothetical protein